MFKRFMEFKLIQIISGLLIALYMLLVKHTTKWSIENETLLNEIIKNDQAFILITWHSRLLMLNAIWNDKRVKPYVLISKSRDGAIITNACRFLGVKTIRGSIKNNKGNNSKGGKSASHEIIKALNNKGCIIITPDGPSGPRQYMKNGALRIARIANVPIYPVIFSIQKRKIFKTWDRFVFPLPFNKGKIIWSNPVNISKKTTDRELENIQIEIENIMNDLIDFADSACGHCPIKKN